MDYCLSSSKPSTPHSLPSTAKTNFNSLFQSLHRRPPIQPSNFAPNLTFSGDRRFFRSIRFGGRSTLSSRRSLIAVASAGASSCDSGGTNTPPLELSSVAGKFLLNVLQYDRKHFPVAVTKQLLQMAAGRGEAFDRVSLSLGSSEACLHRRIAELKEHDYQTEVEDVIYMFILYHFSKINVHLVPRISKCIYNGKLAMLPAMDDELESIHSIELLDMIRERVAKVIGFIVKSNIECCCATTEMPRCHLCRIYIASIIHGYFLKSASSRHRLEMTFARINYGIKSDNPVPFPESWSHGSKSGAFDRFSSVRSTSVGQQSRARGKQKEKLRSYVVGFNAETSQMCAKPRSKEAVTLISRHCSALFGDEITDPLEMNESLSVSVSSLKRLLLEAVAFGSFLWDTEEYVDSVYKLKENSD